MSVRAQVIAESREVLAAHARTFQLAGRFLGPARRDEAAVVYAFCRLVDDLVDEARDLASGSAALAEVEAELRGRAPARPLVAVFAELMDEYGVARAVALELIAGVRSDSGPVALADDAALLRYCYQVAGTVGLMMCGVLGVRDPVAAPFALDLGVAMQLTNICRDVAEDARRGRVYLPASRLARSGSAPTDLHGGDAPRPAIAGVVLDLLELADRHYASADLGMRFIPWRSRLAILVAARVYRAIGLVLRRRGGDAMAGRAVVSTLEKLGWSGVALARFTLGLLPGPTPTHDPALHRWLAGLPGADPNAGKSVDPPRKRRTGALRLIFSRSNATA
ncbi:MAG: phytoene/squalene synthase family protein [Nannocystis sp.]|nr:phytoene/squalene synthase family protein [Nannocystis sp.]MBA3546354.1 phytoene/squalene synthase family protein [Nannocystis sp.]